MGFALWNSKQKVFLIIVMSLLWSTCNGGKILIRSSFGGEPLGKHGCLIKALHSHGHTVTVVRTTKSWYIKGDSVYYNTITVPVKEAFDRSYLYKAHPGKSHFFGKRSGLINNPRKFADADVHVNV